MTDNSPRPLPSSTRRFFSVLLMAIGGLMAALCGGCGALFIFGGLISMFTSNPQDAPMIAGMGLVIGGIPAAIGVGLFLAGRSLGRPDPKPLEADKSLFDADPPA